MSNFEEPSGKEEPSSTPLPSLPDDVAPGCLAPVSSSEHPALSLFSKSYHFPRVIALQKFKAISFFKEPPYKKRRKEEPSSVLSPLPDDVVLSCLARLSRSDYAALSVLSKSYRCLVASPELYKIRSLMGRTETHVYVCLRTPHVPNPRWYILRRRKTSFDLIPIPSPSFPIPSEGSAVVALDSAIYVIGGLIKGSRTSDVLRLDCRTHRWRHVPSMGVARASAAAAVVDGKIYVLGGCRFDDESLSWGEVFDTRTQTWESLPPMPFRKKHHEYIHDCVVRDRDVHAVDIEERSFYYSPREGKWGIGNRSEVEGLRRDWCMIGNLVFSLSRHGRIYWCEQEPGPENLYRWKEVKGLEAINGILSRSRLVHISKQVVDLYSKGAVDLYSKRVVDQNTIIYTKGRILDFSLWYPGARLSNSGGNLLLFWDEMVGKDQKIWCAEISLERCQHGNIWGNIVWSHALITLDLYPFFSDRYKLLYSASVTL
uniref:Putative F-box/kelch-repeat protein n=1 Tax=Noccaea caerulescens TaxID=107243 RepID=A0A1J3I9H2_NOCCA